MVLAGGCVRAALGNKQINKQNDDNRTAFWNIHLIFFIVKFAVYHIALQQSFK